MQCNSPSFNIRSSLSFLGFIKNYPACSPAACKKFLEFQLGYSQSNAVFHQKCKKREVVPQQNLDKFKHHYLFEQENATQ